MKKLPPLKTTPAEAKKTILALRKFLYRDYIQGASKKSTINIPNLVKRVVKEQHKQPQ